MVRPSAQTNARRRVSASPYVVPVAGEILGGKAEADVGSEVLGVNQQRVLGHLGYPPDGAQRDAHALQRQPLPEVSIDDPPHP